MADNNGAPQSGEPQQLDDDALEFVTGGSTVRICSSPTSCNTGVVSNPPNSTITITSTGSSGGPGVTS